MANVWLFWVAVPWLWFTFMNWEVDDYLIVDFMSFLSCVWLMPPTAVLVALDFVLARLLWLFNPDPVCFFWLFSNCCISWLYWSTEKGLFWPWALCIDCWWLYPWTRLCELLFSDPVLSEVDFLVFPAVVLLFADEYGWLAAICDCVIYVDAFWI